MTLGSLRSSEEKFSHLNLLFGYSTKSRFLHRGEEFSYIFLTEVLQSFFKLKRRNAVISVTHNQGINTRESNCIIAAALCPKNVFRCKCLHNVAEVELTWVCFKTNLSLFGRKAITNIKKSWPL